MTCRDPQRPDDQTAKQLVQLSVPEVEVCLHDDGSEPMMYDLDLRWPDGHTEAMEVTIALDEDLLRLDKRIVREDTIIATEATHDWHLLLAHGTTDVRAILVEADHLLNLLERTGITSFGEREEHTSAAVARLRRRLGVAYGFSFGPGSQQSKITLVGPAPSRFFVQPESINEVVEDHARRNERKLALSGCDERHLFVLFDYTSPEGWNAFMEQRKPPELPPQLPEAITTAWVAWPTGRTLPVGSSPVVWRVHRADRWEVLL